MLKHTFSNIIKSIKLYIPLFCIITLILFALLCVYGIRANIINRHIKQIGSQSIVAITHTLKADNILNPLQSTINEEFLRCFLTDDITDFYAFSEFRAGSDMLTPPPPIIDIYDRPIETVYNDRRISLAGFGDLQTSLITNMPFCLTTYSDIDKSAMFVSGDRIITKGRFAENINECNVSAALMRENELSIGDRIEIFLYYNIIDFYSNFDNPPPPQYLEFEIFGVYEDYAETTINGGINAELDALKYGENGYPVTDIIEGVNSSLSFFESWEDNGLIYSIREWDEIVTYRIIEAESGNHQDNIQEEIDRKPLTQAQIDELNKPIVSSIAPSFGNVKSSLNNILTASPIEQGYQIGVMYAKSEDAIFNYREFLDGSLPNEYVAADSADRLRTVLFVIEKTENSFMNLFFITCTAGALFCILIIFYVLKDRVYDIGVFRILGLSRAKIAAMITGEFSSVSAVAYTAALCLYHTLFTRIAAFVHHTHASMMLDDYISEKIVHTAADPLYLFAIKDMEHFTYADPQGMLYGFIALIIFTLLISLAAVLFINRHEPMKVMAER